MIQAVSRRLRHFRLNTASPTAKGLAAWWPGAPSGGAFLHDRRAANTGTWSGTGSHWVADGVRQGMVMSFNGTDDYVATTDATLLNGVTEVTYSVWVRRQGAVNSYAGITIARGSTINGLILEGAANVALYKGGTALVYNALPADDTWVHIAGTWKTGVGNANIYFDGSLVKNGSIGGSTTISQDAAFEIGRDSAIATRLWRGRLDDPRIYRRVLSASELRHIYDCGRRAPLSDLVEPLGREVVGVTTGGVVVPWHLFGRVA